MTYRVRFAPSPTGTLHLGSARTALYNWLAARNHDGGVFILRIEDTDQERSTPESVAQALRVMKWLGLSWDEGPEVGGACGPYVQSERRASYDAAVDQLIAAGHAYESYETKEELDAERDRQRAANKPLIYSGAHRDLSDEQRAAYRAEGRAATIRFRTPTDGVTVVRDLIHGDVEFENALIGDFIIRRSDGFPVYNFACVVDDAAMSITHVIRGDDHLANTPRQVVLYQALGVPVPVFAHVPMILGPDKQKLSKRHGAASVEEMAEAGYLAETVRNFLALLGWSKDDETTLMSTDELVLYFDVARVKKSPAAFDYDKLRWMNGQKLRELTPDEFAAAYDEWRSAWAADRVQHPAAWVVTPDQAALLAQPKVETLAEVPGFVGFLLDPLEMDPQAAERLDGMVEAADVLPAAIAAFERLDEPWTPETVEQTLRQLCADLELKPRGAFGPIRIAVTGRTVAPGLFETIAVLGRERTVTRLRAGADRLPARA